MTSQEEEQVVSEEPEGPQCHDNLLAPLFKLTIENNYLLRKNNEKETASCNSLLYTVEKYY